MPTALSKLPPTAHVLQLAEDSLRFGSVTGETFWVDSSDSRASASGGGKKDTPFASIDTAIGHCVANRGDVILVKPGHSQTVTAANGIDFDVAGVSCIGLGRGSNMPTVKFGTATTADVRVTSANVLISGIRFECDKTGGDHVRMINVEDAYCHIKDCWFVEGTSTRQSLANIILTHADADFCTIENCRFISLTDNADHAVAIDAAVDGFVMRNCFVNGDYDDACVHSASAHLNCLIEGSVLRNMASGQHSIEFTTTATGHFVRNSYHNNMTQATGVDPGSCFSFECYHCDAVDVSGILCPVAT